MIPSIVLNMQYQVIYNQSNQGFSQYSRIGCPKIHIWGELGVQFFFIPLHYTQKYGYWGVQHQQ